MAFVKNKKANEIIAKIENEQAKSNPGNFQVGDTIRVHARIIEGNKERIQVFEGVVIKRNKGNQRTASFTVRKISYNVGVERTFLLHSPRIDKIEVVSQGKVRRARLYYLRPLRGKAAALKKGDRKVQEPSESIENNSASDEPTSKLSESDVAQPAA